MLGAVQRSLQAVEASQRDAGRLPQHLGEEGGRPPRDHGDQREGAGELGQQGGHAGQRTGPRRVLDDGSEGAVEVEEQRAVRRLGRQAPEGRRKLRRGLARAGQAQEEAVVVVDVEARSAPMITTTSTPVTPLTGVAVVSGSTWVGFTPMVVAMDAAGS